MITGLEFRIDTALAKMASSCTTATCSTVDGLHQYLYGGGFYQKRVSKYKSVHVELIDLCTPLDRPADV